MHSEQQSNCHCFCQIFKIVLFFFFRYFELIERVELLEEKARERFGEEESGERDADAADNESATREGRVDHVDALDSKNAAGEETRR